MCTWHRCAVELPAPDYMVGNTNSSRVLLGLWLIDDELIPRLVRYVNHAKIGNYWVDDHTDEIITVTHWSTVQLPTGEDG